MTGVNVSELLPQIPFWGFCLLHVNQVCDHSQDSCSADGQSCYYEKIHRHSVAYNYSQFLVKELDSLDEGRRNLLQGGFLMQKFELGSWFLIVRTGKDGG